MNFKNMITCVLLLLLFFSLSGADSYYVDSIHGNDRNNGLNPKKSWKSVERVNNHNFLQGDSVLFRRGGIWREKFQADSSGTAGAPIYFGAYGTGEKPVITVMGEIPNWHNNNAWIKVDDNIWRLTCKKNPGRLLINNKEVLQTHPPSKINEKEAVWCFYSEALYLFSRQNPSNQFHSIKGNRYGNAAVIPNKSWLILENLDIEGGAYSAVMISGSSHIILQNCNIGRYAQLGIQITTKDRNPSHHITIINNRVDSEFQFFYEIPNKRGVEDGILLHRGAHNCLVKHNEILDWGHTGIYCYAMEKGDPGVYNNVISDNYISGENISYMRGIGTDGREGLCRNNQFSGNLIKNTTVRNQINGNNNWVHHNIIDGIKNSSAIGWATAEGFDLQGYGNGLVCHDNHIENNTIMNCEEAGIRFRSGKNSKYNNHIKNNIIYNCGIKSKNNLENLGIVIDNHESVKSNIIMNNCIYNKVSNKTVYYRGAKLTPSKFNRIAKLFGDKTGSNIQVDPLVAMAKDGYYRLNSQSSCVDNGLELGYSEDFYKTKVPQGHAPDIGACEHQNGRVQ